jgi:hypothetical protein
MDHSHLEGSRYRSRNKLTPPFKLGLNVALGDDRSKPFTGEKSGLFILDPNEGGQLLRKIFSLPIMR